MTTVKDYWERCPVCRARVKEALQCPRCGLDFTTMLEAAREAEALAGSVRYELKIGRKPEAFQDALRAAQLHVTPETLKSLATAALAQGHYAMSLSLWRRIKEVEDGASSPRRREERS